MNDPLIGKVLKDAYRIESALAEGGMGAVYLAEQLSLGRKVVLKILRPNFNDEDFIALFLREARINSQLNHPNVVSVFDFGRSDDGIVYLAMEHLEGQTLSDIVKVQQGLPLGKCIWVMEQLCGAVHAAHKLHIVHRDIKPNNVMVSALSDGTMTVKILDFGISKPLEEKDLKYTQMGMVMGTPGYLAPEQIAGKRDIDPRADIYALGALFYFLCTGETAFEGTSSEIIMHKQLTKEPNFDESKFRDPHAICLLPILRKAMMLDREDRYQDTKSLWKDILAHTSNHEDHAQPQPAAEATRYRLYFSGETKTGTDKNRLEKQLQKALKLGDQQSALLFSGKKLVLKKNLSLTQAETIATKLDNVGAITHIEAMDDATRIMSKQEMAQLKSLPSIAAKEAISLSDISSAVSQDAPKSQSSVTATEALSRLTPPQSTQAETAKPERKRKKMTIAVVSAAVILLFSCAAVFYPPLRYQINDVYWYTLLGNEQPRGVSKHTIKIGMSAALSGSAREIGHAMHMGISAYFHHVNEEGGVHGRQLKLVDLDDGYEPSRTVKNLEQFLDPDDGVFALLGNVGTPTTAAILSRLMESKTILFGTFSGSPIFRKSPPDRYVFNYRASYAEETSALIRHFVEELELKPNSIAVFYQNDSYGQAGLKGVEEALHGYNIPHNGIIRANYERNTSVVSPAVKYFINHEIDIEAIIIVGAYGASAEFTKEMRALGYEGYFANVSFVGSIPLVERLQELQQPPDKIIISQVVPPYDSFATGVIKYREDLKSYDPGAPPSFISLEGYIAANIFVEALTKAGRYLDTEILVDTLQEIEHLDLGIGTDVHFDLSNHQASHRVWGSIIDGNYQLKSIPLEASHDH